MQFCSFSARVPLVMCRSISFSIDIRRDKFKLMGRQDSGSAAGRLAQSGINHTNLSLKLRNMIEEEASRNGFYLYWLNFFQTLLYCSRVENWWFVRLRRLYGLLDFLRGKYLIRHALVRFRRKVTIFIPVVVESFLVLTIYSCSWISILIEL